MMSAKSHLRIGRWAEAKLRSLTVGLRDAAANRRHATADRRILLVRHREIYPNYYRPLLKWLEREVPQARAHFEVRLLPCRIRDWSPYALHVPWLPDPLLDGSPEVRRQAKLLELDCQAHGVPTINPVDRVLDTSKSMCSRVIAKAGLRTPRMIAIDDAASFRRDQQGMPVPYFIREDRAHGGTSPVFFIDEPAKLLSVPLERMTHPVAIEFIDVRSPKDGYYRKYRYLAAGRHGITGHLQVSSHWEVRSHERVQSEAIRDEELQFIHRPDPNHEAFQRAAQVMGLDFVAFDYSYDRHGRVVVWEANTLPALRAPISRQQNYLVPRLRYAFAAVTSLYLERAALPVPARVNDLLSEYYSGELARHIAA